VSIALKHVSEQPPPLRDFRPDVHPRLEQAVGRALLKDPAQRYASADEFIAALEQARAAIASGDNGAPGGTSTWMAAPPPEDEGLGGSRWPWILLVVVLLGIALAAALWQPWSTDQKKVPNVVNQPEQRAVDRLEKAGFEVETRRVESDREVGRVVSQDPPAGRSIDEGSTVELEVSSGPGQQLVPSVRNLPADQARRELNDLGFRVTQDPVPSTSVREGISVRTSPKEGTLVPKGTRVRLFISSGPPAVTVPSVVGQDKDDARETLEGAGFEVSAQNTDSDAPEGEVVGQDPAGGTSADKGSRVTITVSRGPREVDVPDVVGLDQGAARSALRGAGLGVKVVERESPESEGTVLSQSPSGGTSVPEGTTVTITVAAPESDDGGTPPDEEVPDGDGLSTEPNSFEGP
jgi:serine/threonine-protein kinase